MKNCGKIRRKDAHQTTKELPEQYVETENEWFLPRNQERMFCEWFRYGKSGWEIVPPEVEWQDVTKDILVLDKHNLGLGVEDVFGSLPFDGEWRKFDAYVIPHGEITERMLPHNCDMKSYPETISFRNKFNTYKTTVLQVWRKK